MMDTPPAAPAHQFQAQNTQYPPPDASVQYAPVTHPHSVHQSPGLSHPVIAPPESITSNKPANPLPQPEERTRHSSACFPCAKRKVKCDRDVKNPCSNCLKRDQGHLCEVKSQKDRLSSHRASDPNARDGHRDKRPKFESFQSTFRSTPAASNGVYGSVHNEDGYPASPPPQARMTDYGPLDYNPPRAHRTSVSMILRKSDEEARRDAVEDLLPQKRDLLKYIGTYRNSGPHFINPVTTDCDAFEAQACMLLTEMDGPQFRERLSETNPNAELELTRLARLLAVLATGSRIEDSDPHHQAVIAQEHIRRAFKCLHLANYMLRPTSETVETLLLLAQELLNEHQPTLSWNVVGTASRLTQLVETLNVSSSGLFPDQLTAPQSERTAANAPLQDAIVSIILGRGTTSHLTALHKHVEEVKYLTADLTNTISQLYASIPDAAALRRGSQQQTSADRWPPTSSSPPQSSYHSDPSPKFDHRLDNIRRRFRVADISACKSIRDRYEHYTFRLHASFASALTARHTLGDRAFTADAQDSPAGRALEHAHRDALHAFLDFSAISNLPVRTWWMVHFVLGAALDLCGVAQSPDEQVMAVILPRLLQVLEGSGSGSILAQRHQDAVRLVSRIVAEMQRMEGERSTLHVPPEELLRELRDVRAALGAADEVTSHGLLVQQAVFGL